MNCDCTMCTYSKKHPQLNVPRCWELFSEPRRAVPDATPLATLLDSALSIGCYVDLFDAHQPGATEQLVKWAAAKDLKPRVETIDDPKLGRYKTTSVAHGRFHAIVFGEREVADQWSPAHGGRQ